MVTLGETMGLFAATDGGTHPHGFRLGIGGAESNLAIGLARLGATSTWIGRVGNDVAGDLIKRELRAEGVNGEAVVDADAPTGLMVKTLPLSGRSRVDYHRRASAGSRLRPEDVDADTIRGAQILHVTGITPALSDEAAAAIDYALDLASAEGIPISFDVNHRARLWADRDPIPVYRDIARRATIIFAGEDEAAMLVEGKTPTELAAALSKLGPSHVLVKLGPDGCVCVADGDTFVVPAIAISPVDTVGAGDAFAAGYLAELLEGKEASVRTQTAVRAGAFACLGYGDWESLPRRADLRLLDSGDPVVR